MRIALCYTGFATYASVAISNNSKMLKFPEGSEIDVFVSTSNVYAQRHPFMKPLTDVLPHIPISYFEYLPPGKFWRKNDTTPYGIAYDVDGNKLLALFKDLFKDNLKSVHIENECAKSLSNQYEETKWAWLRKNQLHKIYRAGALVADHEKRYNIEYDVVLNMRMDIELKVDVGIRLDPPEDSLIRLFGGWPNLRFMDSYLFDGFVYGNRKTMQTYYEMYNNVQKPYEPLERYSEWYKDRGTNFEYQLETYLHNSGIKIEYINSVPSWTIEDIDNKRYDQIKRETKSKIYRLYNRI